MMSCNLTCTGIVVAIFRRQYNQSLRVATATRAVFCFAHSWPLVPVLLLALIGEAAAQPPDEDNQPLCPVLSPELAKIAAAAVKGGGQCETVCRGCGCKGGPGYRGPRGCVGYADLIRVCGPPPHAACTRECTIVAPACIGRAAGRVWLKDLAAKAGLALTFQPAEPAGASPTSRRHPLPRDGPPSSPTAAWPRSCNAAL